MPGKNRALETVCGPLMHYSAEDLDTSANTLVRYARQYHPGTVFHAQITIKPIPGLRTRYHRTE